MIQINGKKKSIIEVKNDTAESELIDLLKENIQTKEIFEENIKKIFFVKNKIINFVIV